MVTKIGDYKPEVVEVDGKEYTIGKITTIMLEKLASLESENNSRIEKGLGIDPLHPAKITSIILGIDIEEAKQIDVRAIQDLTIWFTRLCYGLKETTGEEKTEEEKLKN